jgi:fused signal recognition particle receptor
MSGQSSSFEDPFTALIQGDPFSAILVAVFLLLCGLIAAYLVMRQIKARRDRTDLAESLKELDQKELDQKESGHEVPAQKEQPEDWSERLYAGLSRTRTALANSIGGLFGGGARIGDELLEQVHEALYRADLGVQTTDFLVEQMRAKFSGQSETTWDQVRPFLTQELQGIFGGRGAAGKPTPPESANGKPHVILIVGVNGVGKTTTIGKLAAWYQAQGKKVLLGAGDTFRAAAIDQLQTWADRTGSDLVRQQPGSDPAAVAFDAVQAGKARGADIVIIDTAGRLHSKDDLMAELAKINRSIAKELPGAPHETLLVIDATTGQNAVQQVRAFSEVVKLTGLVATKLDGTAKGGVLVGIAQQFKVPVSFIGVGEKVSDLRPFDAHEFVEAMI